MIRSLLLSLALGSAGAAGAEENPGAVAAPVLQIPMGSRALGMGTAFTAVASDASALYYNPAGLSRLNAHELAVTFISGMADDTLQHMAYGGPLGWSGISGNGYASAGGSLLLSNAGTIEVNRTRPDGSFLDTRRLNAGRDLVLSAGYSERVGATPLDLADKSYGINHFLGVSGKFVRSSLVETYSAHAFTADMGYLVNSPEAGLTAGLAALNVGGSLRYVEEADPLPTMLRAGLALQGGVPGSHSLTVAADAEYHARERRVFVNSGLEYFLARTYGLRAGYQFMRDSVGLTMGFGLRWRARVLLDYAWVLGRHLGDSHRFTVSYRFGGVAPARRAQERRPFIETVPGRERLRTIDERVPEAAEPAPRPRPRPLPRDERPGIPGWIY